jgi:hypothetical protein
MRDDLQYDLCEKCGEYHNTQGWGIIERISHPCGGEVYEYKMMVSFSFRRMFNEMVSQLYNPNHRSPMQDLYDLLKFPSFKAMPDYENASYLDKFAYSLLRDIDVAAMKRMRAYIKLEEDFNTKY